MVETQASQDKAAQQKLEKRLLRQTGKAIHDYQMIEEGDKVMVAISGGKDSWGMLYLLDKLQRRAPVRFELVALHLDQGEPWSPADKIGTCMKELFDGESMVIHRSLYDVVEEKLQPGQIRCSLCSRLRRGALYNIAQDMGFTKIALGHHRDDLVETLLMNQFFSGRMATMPPKLRSDDGRNTVIRPLCYAAEDDLKQLAAQQQFTIFPCLSCDHLESKRKRVKQLLDDLSVEIPDVKSSLMRAMGNIQPSQLLDTNLWDFGLTDAPEPTAPRQPHTQSKSAGQRHTLAPASQGTAETLAQVLTSLQPGNTSATASSPQHQD